LIGMLASIPTLRSLETF